MTSLLWRDAWPIPLRGPSCPRAVIVLPSARLKLAMQERDKWCWAAVSVDIAHFDARALYPTQCAIARAAIENAEKLACESRVLNTPLFVAPVLRRIGYRATSRRRARIHAVRAALRRRRPAILHLQRRTAFSHFVLAHGYVMTRKRTWLLLHDPSWVGGSQQTTAPSFWRDTCIPRLP
jgi:hypothetical protein